MNTFSKRLDRLPPYMFGKLKQLTHERRQEGIDVIAVGRDGRLSGESLLSEFCNEIIKYGIKVINIGLVTSPLLYYAAKKTVF